MKPDIQAMQTDDALNPGMLWVEQGKVFWNQAPASDQPACAGCHSAASMRGVAARYPAMDSRLSRPVNLMQRINLCRQRHQASAPWPAESRELLSVASWLAFQSRGMPISPLSSPQMHTAFEQGRLLYQQRMGQLNLSCAQCHDQRWGQRLGGSVIPQAMATAYPTYRLEWQGVGSLQRRIRNCLHGVRAESFRYDADELVALEVYLARQATGMTFEGPGVRP